MKLKCKFLLLLMPLLLLPGFVKAEEKTLTGEWKEIESGTSTVKLEEKGEFITQLEDKIKALTLAPHEEGTVFDYSYSIVKEYQEETRNYSKVEVNKLFSTKEDAEEYYNGLEVEGKTNPRYRELFSEEFEVVCEEDCEKEITGDNVCTINETEYKTVEKTFSTMEEAEEYDATLEGYKLVSENVTPETTTITYTLEDKFDSKKEAKKAIKDFEELYGEKSSYTVDYLRDTSKDEGPTTIVGTTKYYSLAEAEAAKAAIEATPFDGDRTVTIRKKSETETVTYSLEVVVTETFATEAEAEAKLVELEGMGYTILDRDNAIVEHTGDDSTLVKMDKPTFQTCLPRKKCDKLNTYVIPGNSDFVIIKQGHDNIVVWTPTALVDQSEFYDAFNANPDPSIDLDDVNVIFRSGYGSFDLSYLGHDWDNNYTFTYDTANSSIVVTCRDDKISHLDYGTFGSDTYYTLEGSITKEETKDVWYVDVTTLLYGYSYYVKASITISTTVYNAVYEYERKTMNCSDPSYALDYEIEEVTRTNYLVMNWFVGSQDLGTGSTEPPETGIEPTKVYYNEVIVSLLGLGVLYKNRKKILKKS